MNFLLCMVLGLCLAFSQASVDKFEKLEVVMHGLAEQMKDNETLRGMWQEHMIKFTKPQTRGFPKPFHCHHHMPPHPIPESVHQLRMDDFKVMSAMGDSITAANGAKAWTIIGVLTEYRGVSWSIGGDKSLGTGTTTLANMLREYTPGIKGYSTGSGSVTSSGAKLNVAYPGDTSHDMPNQARLLISRILTDTSIDFLHDWKLVTLFIGGNDLCDVCHDDDKYSGASFRNNLEEALDILHAGLPRAFVNLVMVFDITPIANMDGGWLCGIVHDMVCDCALDKSQHPILKSRVAEYQTVTRALIGSGRYDTKDDFTVVIQPFFEQTTPPLKHDGSYDFSYFAPDCFHFSELGHEAAAVSLWNNMLEPIGGKQNVWHLGEGYRCPGTHGVEFIPTAKNQHHHKHQMIGK